MNEGSSDIMSFDFSLSYLNWKLREPGRTFVLIESNSNSETVVLIEKKPKRIEILFLNYTRLNECLEVVSKYAMNNFVFVIDLPLACSQEKKISPFLVQNRFRKWAFMNRFKTNFYSQKPILSKKINEHLTEGEEKLFLDVYNWNYHHITYV